MRAGLGMIVTPEVTMADVVNAAHPGQAFLSTELANSGEKKLARFGACR